MTYLIASVAIAAALVGLVWIEGTLRQKALAASAGVEARSTWNTRTTEGE